MRGKDARSLPAAAQEDLRRKAVKAVRSGMSQVEAARVFGVTRQALGRWVSRWREGGGSALRARRRGRPAGALRLERREAVWVVRRVLGKTPDQLRLPFYLWTREAVSELIRREFGLELSIWTVGRYLRRWGLTPQKPVRRAFEQDPAAVRRWLKEEYPAIRRQALLERAEIYWGDEMGLRSDHAAGRSWGKRGQTPVILASGQRFGCNMISAITNRGRLYFLVFEDKFTWRVFLKFLRRLVRQVQRKVFLILDGHSAHKAKDIQPWLARNRGKLKLFFLPGYSPELNPDELLNQDVKANAVGRRPPLDAEDLMSNLRGYVRSTQRLPHVVQSFFDGEHVRYAR